MLVADRELEKQTCGSEMYSLAEELNPICRSITGDGVRKTLSIVQDHIPLSINEVPTGTEVFDWDIPKEWNINDAFIKNSKGEKIVDFKQCNLHVLNYSTPIHKKVSLNELKEHLYTLPAHPEWIPHQTTYYKENWGFCMSHSQFQSLEDDEYEVFIDSTLQEGSLTYGEYVIEGEIPDEILISTHICHPSLCIDNLSGICLVTFLAKELSRRKNRYTYRFLFIPATIGAITWLSINESQAPLIKHGLVATLMGASKGFCYKKSRKGDAEVDRAVVNVLKNNCFPFEVMDFSPYGYDERQFCSPGFNLPVGNLSKINKDDFPQYHSSADNLDLLNPEHLDDALDIFLQIMDLLENNKKYLNLKPKGEPRIGKYGLFDHKVGGNVNMQSHNMALLWTLCYSDGKHSLLDISEKSELSFPLILEATRSLEEKGLLKDITKWGS